jgi:putative peptidoglycan lipid II flippase
MTDLGPTVGRSSFWMASGTIFSRTLGFIRAIMLAFAIGVTTDAADAFGVANQLPNNVYALIMGGVLNAILVPQLVKARKMKDDGRGYIDRFATLALLSFFAIGAIATIAAPLMIGLYTTGWSDSQVALATAFAYWTIPQLFFYGLYSVFGEVLNSRSAFGPFMWAPALNNLVSIAGLGLFIWVFGADAEGQRAITGWGADQVALLAGSATAGVAAQALILLFFWKRIGLKLSLNFRFKGYGIGAGLKTASWSFAMVLISQIGALVQTNVASSAAEARGQGIVIASVAAAAIAWLIFMLPHSIVTVSVATAYYTRISTSASKGDMASMKADLLAAVRLIVILMSLATAGLIVLAYPLGRVFSPGVAEAQALGNVIIALAIGLLPFSLVHMLQRAFFALEDTKTPFVFTSVQVGLHIIGAITLLNVLEKQWLVVGLSLITTSTVTIQLLLAGALLRSKIDWRPEGLVLNLLRSIIAATISGAIGYLLLEQLGGLNSSGWILSNQLNAGLGSVAVSLLMVISFLFLLRALRLPEHGIITKFLVEIRRRNEN